VFDPDDTPVATSEGRRPSSTAGDRLMVGLAALALAGGAVIAISRFLPKSDSPATADATATVEPSTGPTASGTPRPTPQPPALRTFELTAGVPPEEEPQRPLYSGWVRALRDVTIRVTPNDDGAERVVIPAGDAAYVDEMANDSVDPGWYQVQAPVSGFVRVGKDPDAVFEFFRFEGRYSGWMTSVAAGPDGFAAIGSPAYGGNDVDVLLASSRDGRTWRAEDTPHLGDPYGAQLAYGPAGWLLIATIYTETTSGTWVWRSPDLRSWDVLGSIGFLGQRGDGPSQLVGTDAGYVMLMYQGYNPMGPAIWYSADGVLWSERRPGGHPMGDELPRIAATPMGFYLHGAGTTATSGGSFSIDGWDWTPVGGRGFGPGSTFVGAAAAGEQLAAVDMTASGRARAWTGVISGDRLSWHLDASATATFADSVVTAITTDGTQPIAFGWERVTETPLWWVRETSGWVRRTLPEAYRGLPRLAAGGPAGYVLVGSRPNSRGANPVLWHYAAGGSWEPETDPIVRELPDPTAAECEGVGHELLDLMNGSGAIIADCIGDRPITLRAWSSTCEDCYWQAPGTFEAEWLVQPANLLYLSPIEGGDWGWLEAVLPPSMPNRARWEGRWLEVTGHYDDPASSSCRWEPTGEDETWYEGREVIVSQCRGRFVVDRVRVLPD
jgi:hypothetical protein